MTETGVQLNSSAIRDKNDSDLTNIRLSENV